MNLGKKGWPLLMALSVGCLMLFFPLVRSFHLDSAMLAGLVGAFAGAWMAASPAARDRDVLILTLFVYTASVPLLIRDAATGCMSADGAAFWLFIPFFSVFFGFSIGRLMRLSGSRRPRLFAAMLLILFAAGGILLPLFLFPQLYFFNHIFGYWPGAIYDQAVVFPGKFVLYRLVNLTWIAIFWIFPHLSGSDRIIKTIFALLISSLALNYALFARNGLISPESRIRSELDGMYHTEHFSLYYSKKDYDTHEIRFLARLHEFHFRELADTLRIAWPEEKRIKSYLYGDEWQMQRFTGAKGVSYVPVWNRTPQMHMRKKAIDATLRHELVHVVARQFGNRILNASWKIGLVEGLAVALAPASSERLTADQLVVSNDAFYSRDELDRLFSFTGFYREAGPAAYAVSGSFVATLLREYPVEHFKKAYRHSSLQKGYGMLLEEAVSKWHEHITEISVTEEEKEQAVAIFAIPSLFDVRCPRKLTTAERDRDSFRFALNEGDTAKAAGFLEKVLQNTPQWQAGWMEWIRLQLEAGFPERILQVMANCESVPDHPLITVRLADAYVAAGRLTEALEIRQRALLGNGSSALADAAWQLRSDPDRWKSLVEIVYSKRLSLDDPPGALFKTSDTAIIRIFFAEWFRRNPIPSAQVIPYDLIYKALEEPIEHSFFETYRNLIYLAPPEIPAAFFEEKLSGEEWRPVRQQRLNEALRFQKWQLCCL